MNENQGQQCRSTSRGTMRGFGNFSKLVRTIVAGTVTVAALMLSSCGYFSEEGIDTGIEGLSLNETVAVKDAIKNCQSRVAKEFGETADIDYDKSGGRDGDFVVKGEFDTSYDDADDAVHPFECVFKFSPTSSEITSVELWVDGEKVPEDS